MQTTDKSGGFYFYKLPGKAHFLPPVFCRLQTVGWLRQFYLIQICMPQVAAATARCFLNLHGVSVKNCNHILKKIVRRVPATILQEKQLLHEQTQKQHVKPRLKRNIPAQH